MLCTVILLIESLPAVEFEDRSVPIATDQNILCTISGLSQDTPVTWIGPDNNEITEADIDEYLIDQGSFFSESKVSTLTIKRVQFVSLSSGDVFKCRVRSSKYPIDSPEVTTEMVLTLLTLGKLF